MKKLNKSGKQLKKIKGRDGRVRAYWVGEKTATNAKRAAQPKESFLQRHGGKLAAGAALLGVAALNRHKLAGAVRGAQFAHNAIQHSGQKVSASDRASAMFRMAKTGYISNRGMDKIDPLVARSRAHLTHTIGTAREQAAAWRQNVGKDFAGHMTHTLGNAAAEHVGARAGSAVGTAVGSMFGPAGSAFGGWVGGQAGSYLAGRHAAPHIQKMAHRAARRMQGQR